MDEKHKQALRQNRLALRRDLDSSFATSYLYSKDIISENDKDEIEAIKIPGERSERLLDVLPRRGPKAFAAFMDFLKGNSTQEHLYKLLSPSVTASTGESKGTVDNTDNSVVTLPPVTGMKPADMKPPTTIPVEESTAKDGEEADEVSSTSNAQGPDERDGNQSSLFKNAPSRHSSGIDTTQIYSMSRRPRGYAFIINNKNFEQSSGMEKYPRNGTDVDAEALKQLFWNLGFKTEVFQNARKKKTFEIFEEYANMDYNEYDCFMCAILTHGEEGVIYTADDKVQMKELTSKFRGKMMGKPKLFFFQACQGFDYMDGSDQPDGPGEPDVDEVDAPGNNAITLPVEADFMYAYSTVPGYYSWRNSVRGSWFAQAIVSVFTEHAGTMDVLRMMTRVNAEVARQKSNTNDYFSDNKKQIPSVITQLRKELYFFPENVVGQKD